MSYVDTRLGRFYYERHETRARIADPSGARVSTRSTPTLVLLHGLFFDGGMWDGQVADLARRADVLVFDGPGHGKSAPPPPFDLADHADALIDAFDKLGVQRTHVYGLSWGGMVAMHLALRYPERVASLALLNTSADAEPYWEQKKHEVFMQLVRHVGLPPWFSRRHITPFMFGRSALARRPELAHQAHRRMAGMEREGILTAARAVLLRQAGLLARLHHIRVPTLVIAGEEDRATPPAHARAIAREIPQARLEVLPGVGHMSTLEAPLRLAELLGAFFDATASASRR
jgi:pimeloyl-ACP methyl ester carboxylesterase